MSSRTRSLVGYAMVVASIAIFFWWGYQFDTWGRRFSFDLAFLGFNSWFAVGAFGAGFASGGFRAGIKYAAAVVGLLAVALLIGTLAGNYR